MCENCDIGRGFGEANKIYFFYIFNGKKTLRKKSIKNICNSLYVKRSILIKPSHSRCGDLNGTGNVKTLKARGGGWLQGIGVFQI